MEQFYILTQNDPGYHATGLKEKAGQDESTNGTLRKLSKDLYDAANQLQTAITGSNPTDEDQLKAKAGTSENDPGKLRGLAKALHEAAQNLHSAASTHGVDDKGAATGLATAVGATDQASGGNDPQNLREALVDLNAQVSTSTGQLKSKASKVKDKYDNVDDVKQKYQLVTQQATTYTENTNTKDLYQAVEEAMDAFDAVYRPEELLNDVTFRIEC